MLLPLSLFARGRRDGLPAQAPPPRPAFTATVAVEWIVLGLAAFWVLLANGPLWRMVLQERSWSEADTWAYAGAWAAALIALHAVLMAPFVNRITVRPLLTLLIVTTAFASYYMDHLGVYLDPSMLRNTLRTDVHEARELFSWAMLPHFALHAALPLLVLWRLRPAATHWPRALALRLAFIAAMALVVVACVMAVFAPLASLIRNQKEARYLITPANYLWSLVSVASADARSQARPREPIGEDAVLAPSWRSVKKPTLLVLVVGETVRAANWGLSGYARQTTPQLAQLPVINFADVTSCGTNTEVSLPCMFAPVGRRDYDESRIRGRQSLLQLLTRAGVGVTWRDNQSGCKGVCDGVTLQMLSDLAPPGLCKDGRCFDEGLLQGLPEMLRQMQGVQLLVLHPLGNHGPAYFRRYPPAFAAFTPACEQDDLRRCSREAIVNAYDNALRYTDHWLAKLVRELQAQSARVDSAMIFVSDHGESLGENNLWLHGLPYAIAPDVQKKVPMTMWFSEGFAARAALDLGCLRERAQQPAAHDHLFHTLLGLLDVRTQLHEPAWDLSAACRNRPAA